MNPKKTEIAVGIFIVLSFVCLVIMILLFQKVSFSPSMIEVKASFVEQKEPDVELGLPVVYLGQKIGEISEIQRLGPRAVEATLRIDVSVAKKVEKEFQLYTGDRVVLETINILGEKRLKLVRGGGGRKLDEKCKEVLLGEVKDPVQNVIKLIDNLNEFLGDKEIQQKIKNTVSSIEKITEDGAVVIEDLKEFSSELKELAEKIKVIPEDVEGFLKSAEDEISKQGRNLDSSFEKLERNSDKLQESLVRVERLLKRVEEGRGTIGKFMTEDEVYNSLRDSLKAFEGAVKNLDKVAKKIDRALEK